MKRRLQLLRIALILIVPAVLASKQATAGSVYLRGIADGDSTYIEEPSDAFYRMDLYDPPPRETQQRFHSISMPGVQFGNLAYDGFPNDEFFRLGSVTYDDADLTGGSGVATITEIALGVGEDPHTPGYYNYYRWVPLDTEVLTYSGTVTVSNGNVISIDLTSTVELTFNPFGVFDVLVPGTFTVTGDRFDGYMQLDVPNSTQHLIWDFAGTLTTLGPPTETLVGDYNNDGVVDAADYVVWRKFEGTAFELPNRDPEAFGNVGSADYAAWQTAFGGTAGGGSTAPVPEPNSIVIALSALLMMPALRPTLRSPRLR